MSNSSILQGIKAQSSKYSSTKQFVIKSKPNIKDSKQTIDSETGELITATPKDIELFLNYMRERSTRFAEMMAQNAILNEEQFCKKHLFDSICIKTILKSVIDRMLAEKRLGRNLKGMNKSNMEEIERAIWSSLERELAIYQNERKYIWQRDQLKNDLQRRKRQVLKQLENVSLKYDSVQKELCLDQQKLQQETSQKSQRSQNSLENDSHNQQMSLQGESQTSILNQA